MTDWCCKFTHIYFCIFFSYLLFSTTIFGSTKYFTAHASSLQRYSMMMDSAGSKVWLVRSVCPCPFFPLILLFSFHFFIMEACNRKKVEGYGVQKSFLSDWSPFLIFYGWFERFIGSILDGFIAQIHRAFWWLKSSFSGILRKKIWIKFKPDQNEEERNVYENTGKPQQTAKEWTNVWGQGRCDRLLHSAFLRSDTISHPWRSPIFRGSFWASISWFE